MDYYNQAASPSPEVHPIEVTIHILRACLAAEPPLSSPHRDGWRIEHKIPLVDNPAYGANMASFMTTVNKGDVSQKAVDLVSSTT
jgi:hypothetical protein